MDVGNTRAIVINKQMASLLEQSRYILPIHGIRLTFSLSHSRRRAKLRRTQGPANLPKPMKAEVAAAVGWSELVGHHSSAAALAATPAQ